ncbi:unnamed protein product, partial [Notodromas monacha]
MIPFNLMKAEGGKTAYIDTGAWSDKAIKEAQRLGTTDIVASSKDKNYNYIPKGYHIGSGYDYVHCTSNNTIFGTQMKDFPKVDAPLICDMSSDILSRQLDFAQFDMIYAGVQKNMGPAGATMIAVKKSILGQSGHNIPAYLDLEQHIKNDSMYNTPSVFAVYTSMLTLEWLDAQGGVAAIEKLNQAKANLLYNEIDSNPLFKGTTEIEDRSPMNATFVLTNEAAHKEAFDGLCKDAGISQLAGHRSVGGYRASM